MTTTVGLAPVATAQFFDSNSQELSGGLLFTYAAGTTTKLGTYTDSTGGTPNTNPIVLNSRGECNIWIPPGTAYKFTLSPSTDTDPPTHAIWTVDNITSGLALIPNGVDSGTANAYVVTGVNGITTLTAGVALVVKITNTNTGDSTLTVNSLGAKHIHDQFGNVLLANMLTAGQEYLFIYNGTYFNLTTVNFDITAAPYISITPTGNSTSTLTSLNVQATAGSATTREFLVALGLTSATGSGVADKVALYAATEGQSGTGDIWAMNPLVVQDASSGSYNCQCIEADVNNNNADRGNTAGSAGLTNPVTYGISITGASAHLCTSAMLIVGNISGTNPMWNRGITLANDSVSQVSIQDFNSTNACVQPWGTYTTILDMYRAGVSTASISLPNNAPIVALRQGTSSTLDPLITYTASNTVSLGNTQGDIFCQNHTVPQTDNTYTIGSSSNRWSAVWAANGTIQTSDVSQKTNIAPLPSVLPLFSQINPITFQWAVGGYDMVDAVEQQTVQATEDVQAEEEQLTLVNGVMHSAAVTVTHQQPLWDQVPIVDPATGQPLTMTIKGKPAVLNPDGTTVIPAVPDQIVPRTKRMPRMVQQAVTIKKAVERPGKRTHWGFDAAQVGAAFAKTNLDFGGYVKASDGTLALRPDQLIPVLWKAVQEQQAQIQALTAAVAALGGHVAAPGP